MHDNIWHEPVMPTAEEQRMITAAKQRIQEKERAPENSSDNGHAFSWRGLAVVLCVVVGLAALLLATASLIVSMQSELPAS